MKLLTIVAVVLLSTVLVSAAIHDLDDYYYEHQEPSMWQGFKNALSDINPFGSRLGHDWGDTQYRVENIYRDMHHEAQREVADLKEEQFKDNKELQEKIAEIYAKAAQEASDKIERLKSGFLASLFHRTSNKFDYDSDFPYHGRVRHMYDKAKDAASEGFDKAKDAASRATDYTKDAAMKAKNKLGFHEEAGLFDEASKKIKDSYHSAVKTARETVDKAPSAKEAMHDTKKRVQKAYDELFHGSHATTRSTFQNLRDKLSSGAHKVGSTATSAVLKTWHLFIHLMIGCMWLTLGALGYSGLKWWIEKQAFKKQLSANVTGPVVLAKQFTVLGGDQTQRQFIEYCNGPAHGFFSRQGGLRKFSMQRGLDIGSNVYLHLSEWNSIEDLRKALNSPDLAELKKRMPQAVMTKCGVSQVINTGKGFSQPNEGDVIRSEGLRARGPGQQS